MRAALLCLFLAPTIALGQVFYSEEEFYRYLEHKARQEAITQERARAAAGQAEAERLSAREKEHQRVMEAVQDELEARALEAIQWLRWHREHPDSFSLR